MATLTVATITETGGPFAALAAADAGLSDEFANDNTGDTYFVVSNGGASPCVVGITAQNTAPSIEGWGPLTKANGGATVAAGDWEIFGPFPPEAFDSSNGRVVATYDQVSSVSVVAFSK